ncbi:hypothetical protein NQZ68_000691 [Dissostichus eleginoides]|nr:hypothetical protein NQZ68_000691 [Dissostichus eleginoides]
MESRVLTWMLLCVLLRPLAAQNPAPEGGITLDADEIPQPEGRGSQNGVPMMQGPPRWAREGGLFRLRDLHCSSRVLRGAA